jgi:hypothetical protein
LPLPSPSPPPNAEASGNTIAVKVRLLGSNTVTVRLPPGSTVAELRAYIDTHHPTAEAQAPHGYVLKPGGLRHADPIDASTPLSQYHNSNLQQLAAPPAAAAAAASV